MKVKLYLFCALISISSIAQTTSYTLPKIVRPNLFMPDGESAINISGGGIQVVTGGYVSETNSTAIALDAGESFTGGMVDTLEYAVITVMVYADVASSNNGMVVEFSADGVNWDGSDEFTIPANTGKTFSFQPQAKYMRVRYINGDVAQTEFRLQTILKRTYVKPSSHRIQDPISTEDDAELVKSVITGIDDSGTFRNVSTTVDGDLTISDNSSGLSISEGDVTGKSFIHKFGLAPDIDQSDGECTVWDGADDSSIAQMTYVWATNTAIDSISSSSTLDTQNVKIQGLDSDYNLIEQTIDLNGQNRVALSNSLIRVFRGKNNDTNAFNGNIYVYENTALSTGTPIDTTKIRLMINDGNNQTLMALYTIPSGKTGYMRDWYAATAGASKSSQYIIRLWAREYYGVYPTHKAWQLKHISSISDTANSYISHRYSEPEKFLQKTDIMMTVEATAAGATAASVAAGFDIVLVDN